MNNGPLVCLMNESGISELCPWLSCPIEDGCCLKFERFIEGVAQQGKGRSGFKKWPHFLVQMLDT